MSITITGRSGQRIAVAGDITTTLRVPYDKVEERFLLAASDGSLIEVDSKRKRIVSISVSWSMGRAYPASGVAR